MPISRERAEHSGRATIHGSLPDSTTGYRRVAGYPAITHTGASRPGTAASGRQRRADRRRHRRPAWHSRALAHAGDRRTLGAVASAELFRREVHAGPWI